MLNALLLIPSIQALLDFVTNVEVLKALGAWTPHTLVPCVPLDEKDNFDIAKPKPARFRD